VLQESDALEFSGKVAVVTGGANGIGLAAARVLAAGGAQLWIFDLEREHPEKLRKSLGGYGCHVDVTGPRDHRRSVRSQRSPGHRRGQRRHGRVGAARRNSAEVWNRTIAVNLSGMFHTVQAGGGTHETAAAGAIVMTASTNSYDGEATLVRPTNASKAGLLGILHTAANELGPWADPRNARYPGLIRTRLTEAYFNNPRC